MLVKTCGLITSPQYIFTTSNRTLEMAVALDRFVAVFFPTRYKAWEMNKTAHKVVVGFSFFIGTVMMLLTLVDAYDNVYIGYCSSRVSMSILLQLTHMPYGIMLGSGTAGIYVFCLLFAETCVRVTL